MKLEIIATSVQDAIAAERGGADRLELCSALTEGGLTPSLGLIEAVVNAVTIPVHVIVRPHSRTFVFDEEDMAVMLADIQYIQQSGAAGIVIGVLTEEKLVDKNQLKRIVDASGNLRITFHRAFDEIEDQFKAIEDIGDYPQIQRILTSGGPAPAPESKEKMRQLVEKTTNTTLTILAGNGMEPLGLIEFVELTGVQEVHFGSAVREEQSFQCPIDSTIIQAIQKDLATL